MPKLTLSADREVIERAKHLAEERGTSVSAMFSDFIKTLSTQAPTGERSLPPVTRRLAGIAKLPPGKSYRAAIEESVLEKHGR